MRLSILSYIIVSRGACIYVLVFRSAIRSNNMRVFLKMFFMCACIMFFKDTLQYILILKSPEPSF